MACWAATDRGAAPAEGRYEKKDLRSGSFFSGRPLDSYSDICYLGTDELIIFVSFL